MSDERPVLERTATFREVFTQSEYGAFYTARTLSWIGESVAQAAVSVLVYQRTHSVALSAAAFAVNSLPWLVGGALLAAIAERYAYRGVIVVCALVRMVLMALVAIPGVPVEAILPLLFMSALASAPSQAAKSALLPLILPGNRLAVGLSAAHRTRQTAKAGGYLAGAAIAALSPGLALLLSAGAYGLSAALIRFGIRQRPAATRVDARNRLLRDTGEGFRLVFGTPALRAVAVLFFATNLIVGTEALAAGWAAENGHGVNAHVAQAMLLIAHPIGFILGDQVIGRTVRPGRRQQLIRSFAVLTPLALAPVLFDPPPAVVAVLAAIAGFALGGMIPAANLLFAQAVPQGFRARAAGVTSTGTRVINGAAVLVIGLLADHSSIPLVVGWWDAGCVVLMLAIASTWPSKTRFAAAGGTQCPPRSSAACEAEPGGDIPTSAMIG